MSGQPAALAKLREWPHGSQLTNCRFVPSPAVAEAAIVAAGHDGAVHLFSLDGACLATRPAHRGWVEGLRWTPDGRTLLSADSWGQLRAWPRDWATQPGADGASTAPPAAPQWNVENACGSWLRDLAVSADGAWVAVCGNEPVVRMYAVADGKRLLELRGHEHPVHSVAFSPDQASLVSGDLRGGLIDWDPRTGHIRRRLSAERLFKTYYHYSQGGVRSMTFDATGSRLYCGGFEGTNANQAQGNPLVLVFDWRKGTLESVLSPTPTLNGPVTHVAWHPAGWLVAAGSSEGGGALWAWRGGETAVARHVKSATSLRRFDIASDGTRLAAAAFGNLDGQRGGNGRRLDKDGQYPDFGGILAVYQWS
jgi:WD40 repeat protein